MKIIAGAYRLAVANMRLILASPTPCEGANNSDALVAINAASVSPASDFANMVLPVPGGPYNNNPFGAFPPVINAFCGSFK